jgi:hypothetical protein
MDIILWIKIPNALVAHFILKMTKMFTMKIIGHINKFDGRKDEVDRW